MPKGTAYATDYLKTVFNNNNTGGLLVGGADANLYVSLHTADPSGGNQNTNEVAYTGYARVAVTRANNSGWTVAGNNAVNAANITFPQATGGNNTAAFFGIGENNTGTGGLLFYSGALTANLTIVNGITPQFGAGNASITES